MITVKRRQVPCPPTRFTQALARTGWAAEPERRLPDSRDMLTLPHGAPLTVRHAGPADLAAARTLHTHCSARTLRMRYHGPLDGADDADRYLNHLLDPRHGRTLAAQTAPGRIVALGHLLWDGDESEIALLVADAWQRRGIGGRLLGRLVALAAEAGSAHVYAVSQPSNTAALAAMRRLRLPLDHRVEDDTLVLTARLTTPDPDVPGHRPPGEGTP